MSLGRIAAAADDGYAESPSSELSKGSWMATGQGGLDRSREGPLASF
jgi:hypothetical protein